MDEPAGRGSPVTGCHRVASTSNTLPRRGLVGPTSHEEADCLALGGQESHPYWSAQKRIQCVVNS